jgi:HEAT repeat protein
MPGCERSSRQVRRHPIVPERFRLVRIMRNHVVMDHAMSGLSDEELFERARAELRDETGDSPVPFRVELQDRPTRAVFETSMRLTQSEDALDRELGVEILRELGRVGPGARRPFSDEAIPRFLQLLEAEDRPRMVRGLLQALAFNASTESLSAFLDHVDHEDASVRETIAFQLPYLLDADQPDERAITALETLCGDTDEDVRFYALYSLTNDGLAIDRDRIGSTLRGLVNDPDERVRSLARTHASAMRHPTRSTFDSAPSEQ